MHQNDPINKTRKWQLLRRGPVQGWWAGTWEPCSRERELWTPPAGKEVRSLIKNMKRENYQESPGILLMELSRTTKLVSETHLDPYGSHNSHFNKRWSYPKSQLLDERQKIQLNIYNALAWSLQEKKKENFHLLWYDFSQQYNPVTRKSNPYVPLV